jgi:putative transposase
MCEIASPFRLCRGLGDVSTKPGQDQYAFVAAHDEEFQVNLMCRVLSASRSGYYAWRKRPESNRARANRRLLVRISEAHRKSRETYMQLRAEGETCGRGRVAKLMSANDIRAKQKRPYRVTTNSEHKEPVAANLLGRCFDVTGPDRVWVSDITYIPTREGWMYLSAVMDLCSRRIVGWAMDVTLRSELALDALSMAYQRRRPGKGVVHHSDRGVQYASGEYRKLLKAYGMDASMSGTGNCYDNAPMESFFGTLKTELVHNRIYSTREEAKNDIFEYIEVFYNRQRLHSSLGYTTPVQFEAVRAAA